MGSTSVEINDPARGAPTTARKPITALEIALLAIVLIWAAVLRVSNLDRTLFWVDEAESTINALTILEHGVPVDHYLGIPIYENTLTLPWPEHPEYEFKDSSYSSKGVAVYHGWLPLYAIAGSLKAFGLQPDPAPADTKTYVPAVRHDDDYIRRMTKAARMPAVVFGVAFLALLFAAGREMGGRDVGWAALLVAAFADRTINVAREARYYSLTALLGLACCLFVFRMARRGRWQDFILGGIAFGLLFHTHVVTFLVASSATGLALVIRMRGPGLLPKLCTFGGIVAAMTVPWALATGFLAQASGIPKAWPLLRFPADYLLFPMSRPPTLVVFGVGVAGALAADVFRRRLPARFVDAFATRRGAFYLLAAWVVLGYLAFIFLMPAVSFVADRMTLPMVGPGILLAAMIFAAAARFVRVQWAPVLAPLFFLGFMLAVDGMRATPSHMEKGLSKQTAYTIDWLRDRAAMRPGTRVYATPNKHLIFAVYTGIPVQNIAPVRKSFIDAYDGDILLLECVVPFQPPPPRDVLALAQSAGQTLTEEQAMEWSWAVTQRAIAQATLDDVRDIDPKPQTVAVPGYLLPLVDEQPRHTARHLKYKSNPVRSAPAVFRGYDLADWCDWWPVYFYRFVSPENRSGPNLNYADRARSGKAIILPIGWRVFEMPAQDRRWAEVAP